jgi:hypothetical protein
VELLVQVNQRQIQYIKGNKNMAGNSFWDYITDSSLGRTVNDIYKSVENFDFSSGSGSFQNVGRGTGTGGKGGTYDGGFLDYAGDLYDYGKEAVQWAGKTIRSDEFKTVMKYVNKLRNPDVGKSTIKERENLAKLLQSLAPQPTTGRQRYTGRQITGFRPGRRTRGPQGVPASYGMMQPISGNPKVMERINTEAYGYRGYGAVDPSNINLSFKQPLSAITVRSSPYTGTRLASAKHMLT